MTTQDRPRVVVVEDDQDVATLVTGILNDEGFDAMTAGHHGSVADVVRARPRLLVLDLLLGHRGAGDLIAALRRTGSRVPVVLLSDAHDVEAAARSVGASAGLAKPFDIDDLVRACRALAA